MRGLPVDLIGETVLGAYVRLAQSHPVQTTLCTAAVGAAAWFVWRELTVDRERLPGGGLDRQPTAGLRVELGKILARDPAFDPETFLVRARASFARIGDACRAGEPGAARAFVSDGMFERLSRQPARLGESPRILGAELLAARADAHYDALAVRMRWTGAAGERTEVWAFLRRPGARTLTRPGSLEGCCPACGASLSIVDAARCGSCGSWVNSGDHDWVLAEITAPDAWRVRDYAKEVDGWTKASTVDPALSPQALEDRVAALFWRSLDPAIPVSRLVVRAADLVALDDDGTWSRAHAVVEWTDGVSGRAEPHRHYFTLKRASSARTDPGQGLRTDRCSSCGASRSARDEELCAYCGGPLADPRKDWVLESVKAHGEWTRPGAAA